MKDRTDGAVIPGIVIHLPGMGECTGFAACRPAPGTSGPPWWTTDASTGGWSQRTAGGTWVTCGRCRKLGVLPDPGRTADFLPEGSTIEAAGSTVMLTVPGKKARA